MWTTWMAPMKERVSIKITVQPSTLVNILIKGNIGADIFVVIVILTDSNLYSGTSSTGHLQKEDIGSSNSFEKCIIVF